MMAERYGSDQPNIVALHGWARDSSDWRGVLQGKNALAPDLPGFGRSPKPDGIWGTSDYAEALVSALEDVVAKPFILVGHSFGGRIATQLAASRPDLVGALVLTGVPLRRATVRRPPLVFRLAKAMRTASLIPESVLEHFRERYGSADYRATAGLMRRVFVKVVNEDYGSAIEQVVRAKIPVFLVWGRQDQEVPMGIATQLHDEIEGSRLHVVADAGHMISRPLAEALCSVIGDVNTSSPN